MKWISTKKALPKLINREIHDSCVIESSEDVIICKKIYGFKSYCVARYEVIVFNYGEDDENVSVMWKCTESNNYIDAETVYYWAEIVKPESEE